MAGRRFNGKKVLVTGGAGFIGSHLVDSLVEEGAEVTVVDNLSSGQLDNLQDCREDIRFVKGDIRDQEVACGAVEDQDLIFHLAGNASVPRSVEEPCMDFEVNCGGTFHLLNAGRREGVDRFLYSSTAAVYGEPVYTPIDEGHPLNPISPYGASKLFGEKMGGAFRNTYGLSFTSLRVFNVYGPRQRKYVMYDFIRKLQETPDTLQVLGTGEQRRSFCYVEDAVEAFLSAAAGDYEGVYNLAGNTVVSIKDLAELIVSKVSPEASIHFTGESWRGDIQQLVPDNSKIKEELGFQEKFTLDQGVDILIEWLTQN